MDKIDKFLKKLNKKEREALELLMVQLQKDHKKLPGIKKLKGEKSWYRIRFSKYRIVFVLTKKGPEIRRVTKRNESSYKNL